MVKEKQVYQIIMEQINYRRLTLMVGGWNPCYETEKNGDEYFCFRFKAGRKLNYCKITLNHAADTYTVYFCKVFGVKVLNESTFTDIYCDQLISLFEDHTGLVTSL